ARTGVHAVKRGLLTPLGRCVVHARRTAKNLIQHRLDELGKRQAREREQQALRAKEREEEARRIAFQRKAAAATARRQRYLESIENWGTAAALKWPVVREATRTAISGVGHVGSAPVVASGRWLWPAIVVLGRLLWRCGVLLTRGI